MLHIIMNNDSSQRTDSIDTENQTEEFHIETDAFMVAQHCSKPAIRESARDSTVRGGRAENILLLPVNYCHMRTMYAWRNVPASMYPVVYWKSEACIGWTEGSMLYLQWGKEPRHTALLSTVTRNMWQFLKSDSILSMDSILTARNKQNIRHEQGCQEATAAQIW